VAKKAKKALDAAAKITYQKNTTKTRLAAIEAAN